MINIDELSLLIDKSNTYLSFKEIFDISEILEIQNLFAEACGVSSIITEPDGTTITESANFCNLCIKIRENELGLVECKRINC